MPTPLNNKPVPTAEGTRARRELLAAESARHARGTVVARKRFRFAVDAPPGSEVQRPAAGAALVLQAACDAVVGAFDGPRRATPAQQLHGLRVLRRALSSPNAEERSAVR